MGGRQTLRGYSILTAYDLAHDDPKWLLKTFNVVLTRTALELRGQFCLALQLEPSLSKSSMHSMSFGKLVEDYASLRQVISTYAAESSAKMRREQLVFGSVLVFLQTNRFIQDPQYAPQITLQLPTPPIMPPKSSRPL